MGLINQDLKIELARVQALAKEINTINIGNNKKFINAKLDKYNADLQDFVLFEKAFSFDEKHNLKKTEGYIEFRIQNNELKSIKYNRYIEDSKESILEIQELERDIYSLYKGKHNTNSDHSFDEERFYKKTEINEFIALVDDWISRHIRSVELYYQSLIQENLDLIKQIEAKYT